MGNYTLDLGSGRGCRHDFNSVGTMLLGYTGMILGVLLYFGGFAAMFVGIIGLSSGRVDVVGAIFCVIFIVLGMAVSGTVHVLVDNGLQRVWRRGRCHYCGSRYGE